MTHESRLFVLIAAGVVSSTVLFLPLRLMSFAWLPGGAFSLLLSCALSRSRRLGRMRFTKPAVLGVSSRVAIAGAICFAFFRGRDDAVLVLMALLTGVLVSCAATRGPFSEKEGRSRPDRGAPDLPAQCVTVAFVTIAGVLSNVLVAIAVYTGVERLGLLAAICWGSMLGTGLLASLWSTALDLPCSRVRMLGVFANGAASGLVLVLFSAGYLLETSFMGAFFAAVMFTFYFLLVLSSLEWYVFPVAGSSNQ